MACSSNTHSHRENWNVGIIHELLHIDDSVHHRKQSASWISKQTTRIPLKNHKCFASISITFDRYVHDTSVLLECIPYRFFHGSIATRRKTLHIYTLCRTVSLWSCFLQIKFELTCKPPEEIVDAHTDPELAEGPDGPPQKFIESGERLEAKQKMLRFTQHFIKWACSVCGKKLLLQKKCYLYLTEFY